MSTTGRSKLGANLRARRQEIGLSQADLATLAGVHASTVGYIERGRGNPNLSVLLQLCVTLECTPAELLEGVEAGEVPPRAFSASSFVAARAAAMGTTKEPRPTRR